MSKALNLTKSQRRQVEAAAEVFKPWGLTWSLGYDGPHIHLAVQGPKGGTWRLCIAGTPRDADMAVVATRQKAKRLVRDINLRAGIYG